MSRNRPRCTSGRPSEAPRRGWQTLRVAAERELPAQFTPLHSASPGQRVLVLVVGPLLWLVAVVVVSVVADRRDAVEIGLIVTLAASVLSLPVSVVARRRRLREERDAEVP
jgi:hypothetical protein